LGRNSQRSFFNLKAHIKGQQAEKLKIAPDYKISSPNREKMDFRADLERLLTSELRKRDPNTSGVTVSFDGQFAIFRTGDRYQLRKLSPKAREFLKIGGNIAEIEKILFER